jgi:hypothetical protein
VTTTVFASTDDILDASDVQVAAVTKRLKIAAGKSKMLRVKLTAVPTMPAGRFQLLAKIDRVNTGGSDVVGAAGTFAVSSQAAGQLQVTAPIVASPTLTRERAARVKAGVTNVGSARSQGVERIVLYARSRATGSESGAGSLIPVAATRLKAKLAPGRTSTVSLRFTVPASIAAGSYDLISAVQVGDVPPAVDATSASVVVNVV